MKAFVFPGQGSQYVGMGKELNAQSNLAGLLFRQANEVLGFDITSIMFAGTDEQLKETKVTQPAVFLDSVISASCLDEDFKKSMMAGHSLGEFSALVVSGALAFEDGLKLVAARANAMQKACEQNPGTMAAIIGLEDALVWALASTFWKTGHFGAEKCMFSMASASSRYDRPHRQDGESSWSQRVSDSSYTKSSPAPLAIRTSPGRRVELMMRTVRGR